MSCGKWRAGAGAVGWRIPRWWGAFGIWPATVFLTGCFSFVSIDPRSAAPNEDVRVVLHENAAARIASEYGAGGSRLMGRLTVVGTDSMLIAAWVGGEHAGTQFATARQTITLGRADVAEVQRRRLSGRKTALAAAALTGVAAVLLSRVVAGEPDPGEDDPDPPLPPPAGMILRLPLRLPW